MTAPCFAVPLDVRTKPVRTSREELELGGRESGTLVRCREQLVGIVPRPSSMSVACAYELVGSRAELAACEDSLRAARAKPAGTYDLRVMMQTALLTRLNDDRAGAAGPD